MSQSDYSESNLDDVDDIEQEIEGDEYDSDGSNELELVDIDEDINDEEIVMEGSYDDDKDDCFYDDVDEPESVVGPPDEEELFSEKKIIYATGNDRITRPILSKYEYTRIMGDRTKMLELGAKPLISIPDDRVFTARELAELELIHKAIPFIIERQLPDGIVEQWKVSELSYKNNQKN